MISSPHFYQSPDKLREMFEGISDPNEDVGKYETYMNIEPYTGMVVSLHKRLQVFLCSVCICKHIVKLFSINRCFKFYINAVAGCF